MTALAYTIPIALFLGGLGLAGFLWSLKSGQYDDLDGAAWRALDDEPPEASQLWVSGMSCRTECTPTNRVTVSTGEGIARISYHAGQVHEHTADSSCVGPSSPGVRPRPVKNATSRTKLSSTSHLPPPPRRRPLPKPPTICRNP